jgi:hypothetical protein
MANNNDNKVKRVIESSLNLDGKQKRVQIRKNAQQTLLFLHDVIAKKNQRYYTGDSSSGKLPPLTKDSHDDVFSAGARSLRAAARYSTSNASIQTNYAPWKSGYRNIIPIEKGQYADGVSPLTSLGEDVNKFFSFELTSAQQAALYPKLRLYKILYELDGNGNIKLPQKEKSREEIVFEKAITKKELDILTNKGGNIGSSGIESFEWKLMGVNPADTDSNIEASLKIYFNNVSIFAERINDLNDASDLATMATTEPNPAIAGAQRMVATFLQNKAHFLDLITFAPPTTKDSNSLPCNEVYDPSFFEILAEVGWEAPEGSTRLFSTDQIDHIKEQTVKLYLTLTDHKFDFKEDGSATLVANYRARQNFSDPEFDLLYPRGDLAAKINNLNNLRTDETIEPKDKAEQEEELQEDLLKLLKENYKRIISGLLANMYETEIPNALLLNTVLPVRQTGISLGSPGGGSISSQTISFNQLFDLLQSQSNLSYRYQNLGGFVNRTAELQEAITRVQNQIAVASKIKVNRKVFSDAVVFDYFDGENKAGRTIIDPDDDLSDDITPFDDRISPDLKITPDADTLSKIQFFYLGDILEVMFETIGLTSKLSSKKVAFVTTDFEYINLFKIIEDIKANSSGNLTISKIQNFDFSKLKCAEKTFKKSDFKNFYSVLNVANIPIEATAFLDFFTEKIIAQERQNYYLNNFLADLFTELVKPALGDNAVQGMANNQPALINIDVSAVDNIGSPLFESPPFTPRSPANKQDNEYKLVFDSSVESEYAFIRTIKDYQDVDPFKKQVLFQNPPTKNNNNVATVKVIGVNGGTNYLDGRYQTNIREGITNFVVGLDRGLIKSVSFERVDQPYLRESRTATDKSFGVGQLRELYNVNLTLYGNNLVKPGQMIYVEPNRFIFGRPTEKNSVSRLLGLGGYHLVVDVSNTIGKEGWETSVKALHMSMPAIVKQE